MNERKRRMLELIHKSIEARGVAPSTGELAKAIGTSSGTIVYNLDRLELEGYVSRIRDGGTTMRTARLTERALDLLGAVSPEKLLRDIVRAFDSSRDNQFLAAMEAARNYIKTSPKTLNNAQRHPAEVRKLNEGPPARSVADRSTRGRSPGRSTTGGRD